MTVHPNPSSEHLPIGGSLDLSFSLLNRSELPKHLSWKITSTLGGGMDQFAQLMLHGGESKEMQYHWKPSLPGAGMICLSVDEGKTTHQELFWKVAVTRDGSEGAPPPGFASEQKPQESPNQEAPESVGAAVAVPVLMPSIPPIEGVKSEISIPWIGKPRVLISWNTATGPSGEMKIREAVLMPINAGGARGPTSTPIPSIGQESMNSMTLKHVDLPSIRIKGSAFEEKAALRDLSPGMHLIVLSRVVNDGKVEACSQISVCVPNPHSWWDSLKLPLGIIGVVFLIIFLRRISRG